MSRARLLAAVSGAAVVTGAMVVAVSGIRPAGPEPLPVHWNVPEFTLLDQQADTLRAADLRGSVWAVNFFFTNCTGVCPLVNARMSRVAETLREQGVLGREARLVSISVDPARDSPSVLREYAQAFGGALPREWAFLTGIPGDEMRRLLQRGFRVTVVEPGAATGDGPDAYQVSHSPRILLVDRQGRVRGTYDAREPETVETLVQDMALLLAG